MAHLVVTIKEDVGDPPGTAELLGRGGQPLLSLCQKTVDSFDESLRRSGDVVYKEGLATWEKDACRGFVYQLTRGHLQSADEAPPLLDDLP